MIRTEEEHLAHYGIKRRSGRYPWGSGEAAQTGNTRNRSLLDDVAKLRKEGMTEAQIAEAMGMTTTQLRARKSIEIAQQRQEKILTAQRLKDKGWSNVEIGRRMGLNESSVRALTAIGAADKASALQSTVNMLKDQVNKKKYIDVGAGVEHQLGVTNSRLKTAVAVLKEQGYAVHPFQVRQLTTGQLTKMIVLAKPNTPWSEIQKNRDQIRQISEYSTDHGRSWLSIQPPLSISSRRIKVNYADEGGTKADGVIYVRPGVKDLTIGDNRYAQVRIMVDGTHYIKGMAMYKDDLPEGVDLVVNTSKSRTRNKKDVMKEISADPENPFGAIVRQVHDPKTGKVSSAMNMVGSPTKPGAGEEGDWATWSRSLSAQMLSKQEPTLAQQQLDLTYDRHIREYNEIKSLTNPTVRRELLLRFADQTDSSAAHLAAAAMPRQETKVLLPIPSMKKNEIYAPTLRDGEMVALIRYPHGGTFEIPRLKVNNRNREARKVLGNAKDAVGIHHSVAKHLSGADFDGDTVLVIPDKRKTLKITPALEDLQSFDPLTYKLPKGSPIPTITSRQKQDQMGRVSNLITDMTIHGADPSEISRAVRHSMVVIDAEKHNLDWRQSEKDHGIPALKEKYQGGRTRGAETLISRAGADIYIQQRRPRSMRRGGPINPLTGRKEYEPTGRTYLDRKGQPRFKLQKSTRLAEADDAYSLIPKNRPITKMEDIYAGHSNKLKALANDARREAVHTKDTPYSKSARRVYKHEVSSLVAKINIAEKNAPYERQAQLVAGVKVAQKRRANPDMTAADEKKIKQLELNRARIRTGASKTKIIITPEEWNAIQAGALSPHRLGKVLINSDLDTVKRLAMPKTKLLMTSTMKRRAQAMLDRGYTQAEVADQLGVGLTTLKLGLE